MRTKPLSGCANPCTTWRSVSSAEPAVPAAHPNHANERDGQPTRTSRGGSERFSEYRRSYARQRFLAKQHHTPKKTRAQSAPSGAARVQVIGPALRGSAPNKQLGGCRWEAGRRKSAARCRFSPAKIASMRRAFAPRSPCPTRETLRTSTKLPPSAGRMRTTTSSLKPNQNVVAVPSTWPFSGSLATTSRPSAVEYLHGTRRNLADRASNHDTFQIRVARPVHLQGLRVDHKRVARLAASSLYGR